MSALRPGVLRHLEAAQMKVSRLVTEWKVDERLSEAAVDEAVLELEAAKREAKERGKLT